MYTTDKVVAGMRENSPLGEEIVRMMLTRHGSPEKIFVGDSESMLLFKKRGEPGSPASREEATSSAYGMPEYGGCFGSEPVQVVCKYLIGSAMQLAIVSPARHYAYNLIFIDADHEMMFQDAGGLAGKPYPADELIFRARTLCTETNGHRVAMVFTDIRKWPNCPTRKREMIIAHVADREGDSATLWAEVLRDDNQHTTDVVLQPEDVDLRPVTWRWKQIFLPR